MNFSGGTGGHTNASITRHLLPRGQRNSYDRVATIALTVDRNIPRSTLLAHGTWNQGHSFITACKDPQTSSFSHHGGQVPNLVLGDLGSAYP